MKYTIEYNARSTERYNRWNTVVTIEAPTRRSAMARFRAQRRRAHDKLAGERGYERTRFYVRFSGIGANYRITEIA